MVKLTEIFSIPIEYSAELALVKEKFSVREIYLNPDHVITVKQNLELFTKAQEGELIEGLNKELSYTQIFLDTPRYSPQKVNVIGAPGHIAEKIDKDR
jgi:hypothetical protein